MTVVTAASWPKSKHAFHTKVNAILHGDKSLSLDNYKPNFKFR